MARRRSRRDAVPRWHPCTARRGATAASGAAARTRRARGHTRGGSRRRPGWPGRGRTRAPSTSAPGRPLPRRPRGPPASDGRGRRRRSAARGAGGRAGRSGGRRRPRADPQRAPASAAPRARASPAPEPAAPRRPADRLRRRHPGGPPSSSGALLPCHRTVGPAAAEGPGGSARRPSGGCAEDARSGRRLGGGELGDAGAGGAGADGDDVVGPAVGGAEAADAVGRRRALEVRAGTTNRRTARCGRRRGGDEEGPTSHRASVVTGRTRTDGPDPGRTSYDVRMTASGTASAAWIERRWRGIGYLP